MATFVELKCFNKLLLEKMKRQEEQIKILKKRSNQLQHVEEKLESLDDAIKENDDQPILCYDCDLYYSVNSGQYCWVDNINTYICLTCAEKRNIFCCEGCDELFFEELHSPKCNLLGDEFCIHCYMDTIKDNYKKVMKELVK